MRNESPYGTQPFLQTCRGAKKVYVAMPQFPVVGWMAVMESSESPLQK